MKNKYKVFARSVSVFLALTVLLLCVPASIGAINTKDNTQQIEQTGNWNPVQYPVNGTLYKDRVAVSKTIAPTEDENYFDITLKVVAKPRVIDQSVDVVVVMDVSNTMNSTHHGLGVSDAGYDIKDARLTHAKSAVNTFLDLYSVDENISSQRRFGLVTFNSYANTVVPLTTVNTAQKANEIKNTVNSITAPTGNRERFTNIEGGLQLAQNLLSTSDAAFKYIIFITDGFPTTYIESGRTSTTQIVGYDTYMTGSYNASKVGTDGYFADSITKKICTYGVNYSDKAADRADDVAASIKKAGINIFSIGVDVGVQSIPDYLKAANSTTFTTVDRTSSTQVIGSTTESYKNWLKDIIAGGPMIEEAEDTEEIHRYASGNSSSELTSAFENILKDIELIPAETMEEAFTLDPMSDYVEFINFYNPDGSEVEAVINTKNGKDIATFDSATETIKWWLTTTQNFYIDEIGNYVLSVSYKVRLKNEMEGFEFSKAFPTNEKTTFYFKTVDFTTGEPLFGDNSIDYPIPEVEGYYGDFSFTKADEFTGRPLEGAVFRLEHYGESCHICAGDAVIEALSATSDEQGVVSFENLPSGHEYALIEIEPPQGYQPGTIHSLQIAYGETYLDGEKVTENTPAIITNNAVIPVKIQLKAHKTLEGRELKDKEFTFVLEGEYINKFHEKMHNDSEGNVEFFEIIFDDEGTYNFKVYEEKGNDPTVIYDSSVYEIEFNITLNDDGSEYLLETKVNGVDIENDTAPDAFEFKNTLRKPVSVSLNTHKLLDGETAPDGLFNFELKDTNGNVIDTKTTLNGIATFDEIIYDNVGVYRYTVDESHDCGDENLNTSIFFDHRVYDIVVTVTAPDGGDSFEAEVKYFLDDNLVDTVVFENQTRGNAYLKINALKTLDGENPEAGRFTFELRQINGMLIDTATNDSNGIVTFEKLEFNRAGYFVFFLTEVKGTDENIIYDESVYNIFVAVEAHHDISEYFLEVTVREADGQGNFEEIAHLHGTNLEMRLDSAVVFENITNTTAPTEPKATESTAPTETTPIETSPVETTTASAEATFPSQAPSTETSETENKTSETKPQAPDFVKTGNNTSFIIWFAMLFIGGAIVATRLIKRKEN